MLLGYNSALVSLQDISLFAWVGEASSQRGLKCQPGMSDPGGPGLFGANRSRDQLPKWPSMVSQEDLFQECMAVPCPEFLWFQLEGRP